ncbi:MAG TPA: WD40 repeat domain-containing protein, partial [Gemmataceae bacterium]|nr:WD40 repeat domain-containing protein [Gemmataceae bacterium]
MSRLSACMLVVALAVPSRGDEGPTPKAPRTDALGDPLPDGALLRFGTARLRCDGGPTGIAFSADSKFLATAHGRQVVHVWSVPSGKLHQVLRTPTDLPYRAVTFTPDGKKLAVGGGFDGVAFWDVATWQPRAGIATPRAGNRLIAFSPDSKVMATLPETGGTAVRVQDVSSGRVLSECQVGESYVQTLDLSPGGKRLVTCTFTRPAELWDTATGKLLRPLPDNGREWASAAIFTADGKGVLVAASGGVVLWDVETGKELRRFAQGDKTVVAFSRDRKTVASIEGSRIRLWDLETGKLRNYLDGMPRHFTRLVFSPDGKLVAATGGEAHICLWDTATGKLLTPTQGHRGAVAAIAISPDGKRVATGGMDGNLLLRDLADGKDVWRITNDNHMPVSSVTFTPDGKTLAGSCYYSGQGQKVWLWDVATGRVLRRLGSDRAGATAVRFVEGGKVLVSVTTQPSAVVWDTGTGMEVRQKPLRDFSLSAIDFTADGRTVATGQRDGPIVLWDTHKGDTLSVIPRLRTTVLAVAFAPGGRTLASGGCMEVAQVWETLTGAELLQLPGHKGWVMSLAFTADGRLLASGSGEGVVRLWDAVTGRELAARPGHVGPVNALAFTPDGKRLLSGGADSTLLVWDVKRLAPEWKPPAPPVVAAGDLDGFWADLNGTEALRARQAIAALVTAPQLTLPFVRDRFKGGVGKDGLRPLRLIEVLERIG